MANLEKYQKAMLDLTELLTTLEKNTNDYYTKYNEYKQKKEIYEMDWMDKKNAWELKTLKDVDIYVAWKVSDIKNQVAELEVSLKTNQIKRSRLQYIMEYEKTACLMERSLEKEDKYIPNTEPDFI